MSEKEVLDEALPNRLVRVVRTLKRRSQDGSSKEYEQSFRVRKAAPGDRYAMRKDPEQKHTSGSGREEAQEDPPMDDQGQPVDGQEQDPSAMDPEMAGQQVDPATGQPLEAEPPPSRVEVKPLEIPWEIGVKNGSKNGDPIPPEIRKRFDPKNRAARVINPVVMAAPANTVTPSETMMWDFIEPELIDRLRVGRLTQVQFSGGESGVLLVKVEAADGYTHKAFMKIESLIDPYVYKVWGNLYGVDRAAGGFSRRAAATYEIAKATGFDDIVPPTICRYDEFGDLDPILSPELVERRHVYCESIARATGDDPAKLRRRLGGYSAVQLRIDGMKTIEKEEWFASVFQQDGEVNQKDALNRVFEVMPEDRRVAFLRTAVLDFVLWTGDRSLAGMVFGDSRKHSVMLLDNELSLPHPVALAMAYSKIGGEYLDGNPLHPDTFPLLWSDPLLMVAVRGGEEEIKAFDEISAELVRRVRDERASELVRSMMEHQIPTLCIAAMFARIGMLWTNARDLARNPYLAAAYLVEMTQGPDEPGDLRDMFRETEQFVNQVMSTAAGKDYDFATELRLEAEDDESDQ